MAMLRTSLTVSKRRGFTFLEMTVVVVLISLFAAMVMPNLFASRERQQETTFFDGARRLASQGRDLAISSGESFALKIDKSRLVLGQADRSTGQLTSETASEEMPESVSLDQLQLGFNSSTPTDFLLMFYPDGSADEGGLQFKTNAGLIRALNITNRGVPTLDESLAQLEDQRWTAGTYATR
jgi:prepilin-type N-terminal cleavage/methylation domain-containing protein